MFVVYISIPFIDTTFEFDFVNIKFVVNSENKYDYMFMLNDNVHNDVTANIDKINNHIIEAFLLNLDKRATIQFEYYTCLTDCESKIKIIAGVDEIFIADDAYTDSEKRVISFILFNNKPIYSIGALENMKYINSKTDCVGYFYVRKDVVTEQLNEMIKYEQNNKIFVVPMIPDFLTTMLRYLPLENANIVSSRDTDCRISMREELAVKEWLDTEPAMDLHIMRDHPHHQFYILAGMFDARRGRLKNIRFLIRDYVLRNSHMLHERTFDQNFLRDCVYNKFFGSIFSHDSFYTHVYTADTINKAFPTQRQNLEFVGMYVYENGGRSEYHHQELAKHIGARG